MSSDTDSCYSLKLVFKSFFLNPHLRCFVIVSVLAGGDREDRQEEEEVQTGRQRQEDKLRQERGKQRERRRGLGARTGQREGGGRGTRDAGVEKEEPDHERAVLETEPD